MGRPSHCVSSRAMNLHFATGEGDEIDQRAAAELA